jgi:hypothetical protein
MTVRRVALEHERLVYVICADRKLRYPNGLYSHIAYIGTTKNGISRVATSAAYRSWDILWSHGVQSFDVRLVTCRGRQGFRSWCRLERAMLIAFREMFGGIPLCNTQGNGFKEQREFDTFRRARIDQIIRDLSDHGAKSERTAIADSIDAGNDDEGED